MALEKWLLAMAYENTSLSKEKLEKSIQYIYRNCNSVSVVSLIASISMAYPFIVGENMLPIFSFEAAFIWDIHRFSAELNAFSPGEALNSIKNFNVDQWAYVLTNN